MAVRARWLLIGAALAGLAGLGAKCDWFLEPVEANLLPDTQLIECPGAGAVVEGEDVTVAWSGDDPDGTVVAYAWFLDGATSGYTTATQLVIEDVALGSHVFTVAAVDNDGGADPGPAVCEFSAGTASGLVPRVVLAELLTTRPCINCPNAEAALNIMLDEFGADSLCVIAYHDHPGASDPMATAETEARIDWYVGGDWEAPPAVLFDGDASRIIEGASTVTYAASRYRAEIAYRKGVGSPVSMRLSGDAASGSVTVNVKVREPLPSGSNVLRVVVIEDDVIVTAHEYDFVARDILDDETLALAAVGDSLETAKAFTVDPGWNAGNLDVIAFVQNDDTKEVLQSVRLND